MNEEFIAELKLVLLLAQTGFDSVNLNKLDDDTLQNYADALVSFESYVEKCEAGMKK
jgi:hypothetical protein